MRLGTLAPVLLCVGLAACVSTGSGEEEDLLAMPTDTYDNCSSAGGFLTSGGGGGGAVRLGMSECELIDVIGEADEVTPQYAAGGERRIIMTYEDPSGGSTAYLFVNNELKEINRVQL